MLFVVVLTIFSAVSQRADVEQAEREDVCVAVRGVVEV